jgi:4-hydroxy-3-methylbut-2-enyl diphosphate reductase
MRLVEVGERAGCPTSILVERAEEIPWERFAKVRTVGVTAGASAPEILVEHVIDAFRARFEVTVDIVTTTDERVVFNVPRELRASPAVR